MRGVSGQGRGCHPTLLGALDYSEHSAHTTQQRLILTRASLPFKKNGFTEELLQAWEVGKVKRNTND